MKLLALILAATATIFLSCSLGTGSEVEGRCAIEGRAVDGHGDPVVGAKVRVRPVGFIALYADEFTAFDTVTDNNGFYRFDTIPADSYTIEINKEGKTGALQALKVALYDSFPIVLPADTLTPTGTIYGRINLPISDDTARPWVALYNVDHMVKAPITQDFRFEGVPVGVFRLRIIPDLKSKLAVELYDIAVTGDSVVDVGTLNLKAQAFFKGCASYRCDSTAVRSILDANGKTGLAVGVVARIDTTTGRIVELDLAGLSLTTLPKDLGSLSMLTTLDLRKNLISVLPEHIGYLRNLKHCYLDSNLLYELPFELTYIDSLKELTIRNNRLHRFEGTLTRLPVVKLDLGQNAIVELPAGNGIFPAIRDLYFDNNQLVDLPAAITGLRLDTLSIAGNRLCTVPDNIAQWLTDLDVHWKEQQNCP